MTKLRRRPSPDLTAYQWQGDENTIPPWVKEEGCKIDNNRIMVPNPSGVLVTELGDWVVKRTPGDCYVVREMDREELFDIILEEEPEASVHT